LKFIDFCILGQVFDDHLCFFDDQFRIASALVR